MPYSWSGIIPGTLYAIADAPITATFSTFVTWLLLLLLLVLHFVCQQVGAASHLFPLPIPYPQRCHPILLSACSKKQNQTNKSRQSWKRRRRRRRGTDICFYCKPIRRRQQSYRICRSIYCITFLSFLGYWFPFHSSLLRLSPTLAVSVSLAE